MNQTSPKVPVLVFGAGGHAKSVIDVLMAGEKYHILGLIGATKDPNAVVLGHPVLGSEPDLLKITEQQSCINLVVAVGDNYQRQKITGQLLAQVPFLKLVTAIHPSAVVSPGASIGDGVVIMAGSVINAGSVLRQGCLVNTNSVIEHDCRLDDFSSLAPGAVLGGSVHVGTRSSIGLGANVIHRISVGPDTCIGAGSTVISDIPAQVVAYGSPCKARRGRTVDEGYL